MIIFVMYDIGEVIVFGDWVLVLMCLFVWIVGEFLIDILCLCSIYDVFVMFGFFVIYKDIWLKVV